MANTPKTWAEKNIGAIVREVGTSDPSRRGRVIGHCMPDSIIFEPESGTGWAISLGLQMHQSMTILDPTAKGGWAMDWLDVQVITTAPGLGAEEPMIRTSVKRIMDPYPHKCPKCNYPALILALGVDCKNSTCTVRRP